MPRARLRLPRNPPPHPTRIPAILRTRQRKVGPHGEKIEPGMPRLWNAKRRIKVSKGLSKGQYSDFRRKFDPLHPNSHTAWRQQVSPDVVAFVDKNKNLSSEDNTYPIELSRLLRNPSIYFSRPHRVPTSQRKQIYFPDFSITLMRTPHNPPSFASFRVPLWFSKLDLRSYLFSLYNVEVVHIRSWVQPNKVERADSYKPHQRGMLYRPKAKKKMTVQLCEPFIWPDEVTDFTEWEKEEYWRVGKAQVDMQRQEGQWGKMNPNRRHRKSVADQARELMEGKRVWKPTWQSIPGDERVLRGVADILPPPKKLLPQQIAGGERQPLRRIPMDSKRVPTIEAPVREMAELRV